MKIRNSTIGSFFFYFHTRSHHNHITPHHTASHQITRGDKKTHTHIHIHEIQTLLTHHRLLDAGPLLPVQRVLLVEGGDVAVEVGVVLVDTEGLSAAPLDLGQLCIIPRTGGGGGYPVLLLLALSILTHLQVPFYPFTDGGRPRFLRVSPNGATTDFIEHALIDLVHVFHT